jgi:hypothetical protein
MGCTHRYVISALRAFHSNDLANLENAIIQLLSIQWKILLLWEQDPLARRVRITEEREQPVPNERPDPIRPGPAGHVYFRELSRPFRPGED